jgi:hypothetical protein
MRIDDSIAFVDDDLRQLLWKAPNLAPSTECGVTVNVNERTVKAIGTLEARRNEDNGFVARAERRLGSFGKHDDDSRGSGNLQTVGQGERGGG